MRKKIKSLAGKLTASILAFSLAVGITIITSERFALSGKIVAGAATSWTYTYGDFEYTYFEEGKSLAITKYKGSANNVTIPASINNLSVVSIDSNAFEGNTALTIINLPNGLKKIGYRAFAGCSNLSQISIPDSVDQIFQGAFSGCSSLKSVKLPASTIELSSTFWNCTSLESIVIPDKVYYIGDHTFAGCTSLKTVSLPSGLQYMCSNAFNECTSLETITIPAATGNLDYKNFNDPPFIGCISLKSINVASGNKVYTSVDGVLFTKDKTELIKYPDGKSDTYTVPTGTMTIGDSAFRNCTGIKRITIPETVTKIGEHCFDECENLETVTLSGNGLTVIGEAAFSFCKKLENISLPRTLTSLGKKAFYYCESIKEITIPGGVEKIEESAFEYCRKLKEVTISDGVKEIGNYAFLVHSNSLENLILPESLLKVNVWVFPASLNMIFLKGLNTEFADAAFYGVYNRTLWVLEGSKPINANAFAGGSHYEVKTYKPLSGSSSISSLTAYVGESIKIDTVSSGGTGNYIFEYSYKKKNAADWTVIQSGADSLAAYTLERGTYILKVRVIDDFEEVENTFEVEYIPTIFLDQDILFEKKDGEERVLLVHANYGSGHYNYSAYYKYSTDADWKIAEDMYCERGRAYITLTPKRAGEFCIKVIVTDSRGDTDEKIYTFDIERGAADSGWKKDSKGWWYQNEDGSNAENQWKKIFGKWYHFDVAGYMQTGWYQEGSAYYYLKSNGQMAVNEWVEDGKYYVDEKGKWVKGKTKDQIAGTWKKDSTGWWYQYEDRSYPKNQWKKIEGKWYHFDADGYMQTGWYKEGKNYYYLKSNGVMACDEWVEDGKYYLDADGKWVKGKAQSGTENTGSWKKDSKGWWYENADGTYPEKQWKKIGGKWYHFDENGYMQTGWYQEGSTYYYLKSNGSMAADEWVENGKYYVDSNGHWVKDAQHG